MVLVADMKSSDFVRQEATRVDYGSFSVDGKEFRLPVNSYIFNDIAPNGDDSSVAYVERHTLFYGGVPGFSDCWRSVTSSSSGQTRILCDALRPEGSSAVESFQCKCSRQSV